MTKALIGQSVLNRGRLKRNFSIHGFHLEKTLISAVFFFAGAEFLSFKVNFIVVLYLGRPWTLNTK